jgi:NAD(P)-dependent dehydrogenase (short-subunit alcohol dehydrogenase family)
MLTILVIGCGRNGNMGEAAVKLFREKGHTVIGADIVDENGQVDFLVDVTSKESIDELFSIVSGECGRLDAIVNCVGVNLLGAIDNYRETDWDRTIDINLKATFLLMQAYVAYFGQESYTKHYVVIGSNTAYVAKTRTFAYGASKAGLTHLVRCLARELAPKRFALTTLDIGAVEGTPMDLKTRADLLVQRGWDSEESNKMLTQNIPWGRMATVHEVAQWLLFLVEKGEFATGCNLRVDGGQQQG